jgi:transcriptional regulator with XRE-family HTH domain
MFYNSDMANVVDDDATQFWQRYDKLIEKDLPVLNKTGLSHSTLSTWKKESRFPRADAACQIAAVLNTTVEYLVTGKEPDNSAPSPAAMEIAAIADRLTEEDLRLLKDIAVSMKDRMPHNQNL